MNDDPNQILSNIYEEIPRFDSTKICFRRYRNFDHREYSVRPDRQPLTVFEDFEYFIPGEGDFTHELGADSDCSPLRQGDIMITSCITDKDHLWTVPAVYNNYHFVQTHKANKGLAISCPNKRRFVADILFGNQKPHRKLFFDLLKENSMLDYNIINLFGIYRSGFLDSVQDEQQKIIDHAVNQQEYANTTLPYKNHFVSQSISPVIMQNSWFSVVGETVPSNECFFVTEKTAKPLLSGRPFIMLGGRHYLKQLREQGFKTFHPVIDESYDEIADHELRVRSAFASFKRLSKANPHEITNKLMPIIKHNQEIMQNMAKLTKSARQILDRMRPESTNRM